MRLKSNTTLAATLTLILMAGCKVEVAQDVYLSDVASVRENGTAMPAEATISIEVPSEEKCNEASTTLTSALSAHFTSAEYRGCRQVEFTTFADFSVKTEMVVELVNDNPDSKFPVYLGVTEFEFGADIAVFRNNTSMQAMMDAIKQQSSAPINDVQFAISARIVNDTSGSASIYVQNVFLGSEPVPYLSERVLERRDEIVVRASDVANKGFDQGSWVVLATLPAQSAAE